MTCAVLIHDDVDIQIPRTRSFHSVSLQSQFKIMLTVVPGIIPTIPDFPYGEISKGSNLVTRNFWTDLATGSRHEATS